MEPRALGRSGLKVSPIGLGLAALGRPGYINLGHADDLNYAYDVAKMEEHAHTVLDLAWAHGVRYFDVARSYGLAESFLGQWLATRRVAPAEVTVGSKWGYTYTAGWQVEAEKHEVKEHSLAVLQRQMGESQATLSSYLDLYQIHSATLDSGVLENAAVLDELARLRDTGLAIGISLSGPQQAETLQRAMEIRYDGEMLFGAVQATWNLLAREAEEALQVAHQAGMGVIVKEALANGHLTTRNDDPNFAEKRQLLEGVAAELETTVDALALAAALARPWAGVVLSGAATTQHLLSNLTALNVSWDDEMDERLLRLAESPESYWGRREQLDWN
jgi:aryl-alcohol dehydrogenase-like predicted oxidoreductase